MRLNFQLIAIDWCGWCCTSFVNHLQYNSYRHNTVLCKHVHHSSHSLVESNEAKKKWVFSFKDQFKLNGTTDYGSIEIMHIYHHIYPNASILVMPMEILLWMTFIFVAMHWMVCLISKCEEKNRSIAISSV